jgi:hypothetical protein
MANTYIQINSYNIQFVAGKKYRLTSQEGSDAIITINETFLAEDLNNYVLIDNAQKYTLDALSTDFWNDGDNIGYVEIVTTSTGLTLKIEQAFAQSALRDASLAGAIRSHTYQIAGLETAAAGKAVIDDTSTAADKVLSASKTLALIATTKTELETFANNAASGIIDDTSTGTDKVLSASKITALLTALDTAAANYAAAIKTDLLSGADSAYDTLKEIQTFLEQNAGVLTALEQAGLNKVSFTELQSLSPEQKQTARTNIGAITADEATTMANDRIAAVVGDPSTLSIGAIFSSIPLMLA